VAQQLRHIDAIIEHRRATYDELQARLSRLQLLTLPPRRELGANSVRCAGKWR
jgi:hypothetical protein